MLQLRSWGAGWVSVCHSRYCIKMTKPILKLFRPSVAPSFKLLWPLAPIPNSGGTPTSGALNTRGGKNWRYGYRRLSRKRCKLGRWLLWNVNRKSQIVGHNFIFAFFRHSWHSHRCQGHSLINAGLNGIIFDDLDCPLTRVSRSLYTYKSNICAF